MRVLRLFSKINWVLIILAVWTAVFGWLTYYDPPPQYHQIVSVSISSTKTSLTMARGRMTLTYSYVDNVNLVEEYDRGRWGFRLARIVFPAGYVVNHFTMPALLVAALLAGLPALQLSRALVRRFCGQCMYCGYDLRGSKGRCSECGLGAAVASEPGAPA